MLKFNNYKNYLFESNSISGKENLKKNYRFIKVLAEISRIHNKIFPHIKEYIRNKSFYEANIESPLDCINNRQFLHFWMAYLEGHDKERMSEYIDAITQEYCKNQYEWYSAHKIPKKIYSEIIYDIFMQISDNLSILNYYNGNETDWFFGDNEFTKQELEDLCKMLFDIAFRGKHPAILCIETELKLFGKMI